MTEDKRKDGLELKCKFCGKEFIFTKREQEFYKEKGLQNIPKACPNCREKRKTGEKIDIIVKCDNCGKTGTFRKQIDAKRVLCEDCYNKTIKNI